MSGIDPNNLGPLVYKQEQVVTQDDLVSFIDDITAMSNELAALGQLDLETGVRVDTAIHVLDTLLEWIENNKQAQFTWFTPEEEL